MLPHGQLALQAQRLGAAGIGVLGPLLRRALRSLQPGVVFGLETDQFIGQRQLQGGLRRGQRQFVDREQFDGLLRLVLRLCLALLGLVQTKSGKHLLKAQGRVTIVLAHGATGRHEADSRLGVLPQPHSVDGGASCFAAFLGRLHLGMRRKGFLDQTIYQVWRCKGGTILGQGVGCQGESQRQGGK